MHTVLALLTVLLSQLQPLSFSLDPSSVEFSSFRGKDAVFIPGGASPFSPGEPALPGIGYSMVIPPGSTLYDVSVSVVSSVEVPGVYSMLPVVAVPLSMPVPSILPYSSEAFGQRVFPASSVHHIETGNKSGFRIASFSFVPFQWEPATGKLSVITGAVLTPELSTDPNTRPLTLAPNQVATATEALQHVVMNPEMLGEYAPATGEGSRGAPWVAIADEAHQGTLQPLLELRNTTHGSQFVSTQWIYENYEGRDTQEQIRNYLKDAYENQGLVYALIVGDFGETTRLSGLNISGTVMDAVTDLYFSDLDGSWDQNGNGIYGEISDGVDYYSDIYVGRFSTDVPSRLGTMVEKAIAYETDSPPGSWRTTALLAGAGLWVDDPPGYWGSFVCDSIDKRIPDSWTVHKLYEDYSSHPNNQIELYNQGVSYSSVNGHGNHGGVFWFYNPPTQIIANSNYFQLTNDGMPIVFHSMACHPGHLQDVGCIAERLMFWPDGGGIAVMFNSHWGIGTPPGVGPSEWLEIFFAEALFVQQQYELGVAHAVSKDDFKASMSISYQRWILQENNFLGDPALRFASGQAGIEGGEPAQTLPLLTTPAPNPVTGQSTISCEMPFPGHAEIAVFDLSGRRVAGVYSGFLPPGSSSFTVGGEGLPAGCYSVVVTTGTGSASVRMLVLN